MVETENGSLHLARALRDSIERGDMQIGIAPMDTPEKMIAAYQAAGAEGVGEAWLELGQCYARWLVEPPEPDAVSKAYRAAADAGSREGALAFVQHQLFGGRDPELEEDIRHIMKEQLESDEDGAARTLAGYLCFHGYAFEQDPSRSLAYHRDAAEAGNSAAMFELYVMLSTGQGTDVDEVGAMRWCTAAAAAGNPRATYNLGTFYATGRGVEKDIVAAREWYEKAASLGHSGAAFTLGVMFLGGDGVEQNDDIANEWLRQAHEAGYPVDEKLDQMGF